MMPERTMEFDPIAIGAFNILAATKSAMAAMNTRSAKKINGSA